MAIQGNVRGEAYVVKSPRPNFSPLFYCDMSLSPWGRGCTALVKEQPPTWASKWYMGFLAQISQMSLCEVGHARGANAC